MIKPAGQTILLVGRNGDHFPFEEEQLREELVRCFLDAGHAGHEEYAEDIALAVEYSLRNSGRAELCYNEDELAAVVGRILTDTGFPAVAALFRAREGIGERLPLRLEAIRPVLAQAVERARLDAAAEHVLGALRKLGLAEATPTLIAELGKHLLGAAPQPLPPFASNPPRSGYILGNTEILDALDPATAAFFHAGIFELSGISRIFPSIRIRCHLLSYASRQPWRPPVMDMEFLSHWELLGTALENCRKAAHRKFRERATNLEFPNLPFCLHFSDIAAFTEQYLGAPWPEGKPLAEAFVRELAGHIKQPVYQLRFS